MVRPCTSLARDERAEFGTGSLVMLIVMMIAAAVVSGLIIRVTEVAFDSKGSESDRSSANAGALPLIIRLEVVAYDPTNVATDSLMLNVDFPYAQYPILDTSVSWVVACPATGADSADEGFYFDGGDFSDITGLNGDGATAAAVSTIENDKVYFLLINLNNCDVEPSETHYLIISVDGANTITKELDYGPKPSASQDLM